MRKASTLQCALVRFWVPLLLVVSFCYAIFVVTTTDVSGNEVNTYGKVFNEELAKVDKFVEAKLKGVIHPKPTFKNRFLKKPIPIIRKWPIPKPFVVISPAWSSFFGLRDRITSNQLWPTTRPAAKQDSSSSS